MMRLTDAGFSPHACNVVVCVRRRENPLTRRNLSAELEIDFNGKALILQRSAHHTHLRPHLPTSTPLPQLYTTKNWYKTQLHFNSSGFHKETTLDLSLQLPQSTINHSLQLPQSINTVCMVRVTGGFLVVVVHSCYPAVVICYISEKHPSLGYCTQKRTAYNLGFFKILKEPKLSPSFAFLIYVQCVVSYSKDNLSFIS